jgi:glycosyltransferase involved in cell wall biosynthesis
MKTLYISSKPCFPAIDGGCVASLNFLTNLLNEGVDINYLTIGTRKHPFRLDAFPPDLRTKIKPSAVTIQTGINFFSAFISLFNNKSYNIERFFSEEVEAKILDELSRSSYDIVLLDGLYVTPYMNQIRAKFDGKILVRTHNVEFKIWEDLAKNEKRSLKGWYLNKLAKDLKRYECSILKEADGVITISNDDSIQFDKLKIKNITSIPFTIEPSASVHDYSNQSLFHIGAMNWEPNIEAVQYVLDLMPQLRSVDSQLEFIIAGMHSKEKFQSNPQDGIVVMGYVEDLERFANNMGILITPIQSGSGVRIKILEMMAQGVPIITTSIGAQGLIDFEALRIADTKAELLNAIHELRVNETSRSELGLAAKRYIAKHHDPKTIRKKLIAFIQST